MLNRQLAVVEDIYAAPPGIPMGVNEELEAFSYHSQEGWRHSGAIAESPVCMSRLIDVMLEFSRMGHVELMRDRATIHVSARPGDGICEYSSRNNGVRSSA